MSTPIDARKIAISPKLTVRTDTVADLGHAVTFVLVDADNHADTEAYVVLTGALVDAHGAPVGQLKHDALRIPPGGRRTFALLDDAYVARPTAVSAKITVEQAYVPDAPEAIHITNGHVYTDQGRAIAAGFVVNDATHPGKAVVIAGFYDADGKPMTRPFTVYEIGAGEKRPAQFVGPPGSASAYIFVGDTTY